MFRLAAGLDPSVSQQREVLLGTGEGTGRKVKIKGGQKEFMMLYKALQLHTDTALLDSWWQGHGYKWSVSV